jgi:hypothetical protein
MAPFSDVLVPTALTTYTKDFTVSCLKEIYPLKDHISTYMSLRSSEKCMREMLSSSLPHGKR